jgi:hypothetical protein
MNYEQDHKRILDQMVAARRQGDMARLAELEKEDRQLLLDKREQIIKIESNRAGRDAVYPEGPGPACPNFWS